jgi:antirestriction protein ArdC
MGLDCQDKSPSWDRPFSALSCSGSRTEPRQDHAAYLASWLQVLKSDKRAIFTAASKAQAAVDYLNALQGQQQLAEAA